MKTREVISLLKRNGFEEIRQNGSHKRFSDGKGRFVTVPYHGDSAEIPKGTLNSILKQAGLK